VLGFTRGAEEGQTADPWPAAIRAPMLDMLKENRVSSRLDGWKPPKGDRAGLLLKHNWYGRRFLQSHEPMPAGLRAVVLSRVSRDGEIGVMYMFLRSKVDLGAAAAPAAGPR
jgi:hypothetical protein